MSCTNHSCSFSVVASAPSRVAPSGRTFMHTLFVLIEALQEAWELRRAACKRYPFDNE